ncbi:hypothetical protein DTL21_23830 [Bremerella cremea]|uniref:Pilus assembly protein PilP n=1 Tax=Blastopirellula marina TaxID=124 RepID=A0A2S8FDZ1_9BACT|nr:MULTISPECIES: hypothetical protein [Pirellulaceae]PQO30391.1 hypothetical protein C5Y83_23790 [Blastopirellula marina]RCS43743.1 hypothetical protein DTL21_23830 [Bremerella cremea]
MVLRITVFRNALSLLASGLSATGCGIAPISSPIATEQATAPVQQPPELAESEDSPIVAVSEATSHKVTQPVTRMTEKVAEKRNPFQPPSVTVRTVTQRHIEKSDLRLLGIAKRQNDRFVILEKAGKLHKASVGDFVLDWEVTHVEEEQATLRRGLEEIKLSID